MLHEPVRENVLFGEKLSKDSFIDRKNYKSGMKNDKNPTYMNRRSRERNTELLSRSDTRKDDVHSCPVCCVAIGIRTKSFTLVNFCLPYPQCLAS